MFNSLCNGIDGVKSSCAKCDWMQQQFKNICFSPGYALLFFSLEEKKNDKNVNVIECSKHSVFSAFFFRALRLFSSLLLTFSFFLLLIRSFFLSSMITIVFFSYHYYSCFYTGGVLSFAVVVVFCAESRTLLHGRGVHPGLRVPGASQDI